MCLEVAVPTGNVKYQFYAVLASDVFGTEACVCMWGGRGGMVGLVLHIFVWGDCKYVS